MSLSGADTNRLRLFTAVLFTATSCIAACTSVTTEPETGVTGSHGNVTSNSSRGIASEEMPDEQRLLMKLLRSYDPGIRPVFNVSQNVVVNFSLTLVQIMDMVSKPFDYYTPLNFHGLI